MAELTIEQKRAIAVASARLRLGQQPAADPNQAIKDLQKDKYKTSAEMGGKSGAMVQPETRSLGPWELAGNSMANLRGAVVSEAKRIGGAVYDAGAAEPDYSPSGRYKEWSGIVRGAVEGVTGIPGRTATALNTFGTGAMTGDSSQMAEGTVGFIEEIPNIIGIKAALQAGARPTSLAITSPEGMRARALANREAVANSQPSTTIPLTKLGLASKAVTSAFNPARRMAANIESRMARWMEKDPKYILAQKARESQFAKEQALRADARGDKTPWNESGRNNTDRNLADLRQSDLASRPIRSPGPPSIVTEQLRRSRENYESPEDAYAREVERRNIDADYSKKPLGDYEPVGAQRPVDRITEMELERLRSLDTPDRQYWREVENIEQGIAPSGNRAKVSTLRNVPALIRVAPKFYPVTPAEFPTKITALVNDFGKTIEAVESKVPRSTTVPKQPVLKGLAELVEEYTSKNAPWAEAAATKLNKVGELWAALPENIPWETFRDMKRAFFEESRSGPTHMRRAYGHLMEAASKVSPELSKANEAYSAAIRAAQDGGVDIRTGRRISQVGKKQK